MAKKCSICKGTIEETFLRKPVGTWMKDSKGKKHLVCSLCQKQHTDVELKEKL